MKLTTIRYLLPFVLISSLANAGTTTVEQKDKSFVPNKVTVKVGDKVNFANADPFFHNVFSLSDVIMFDLGSYPKGESKEVVFDQPGEVEVECAIHPDMKMTVIVEP